MGNISNIPFSVSLQINRSSTSNTSYFMIYVLRKVTVDPASKARIVDYIVGNSKPLHAVWPPFDTKICINHNNSLNVCILIFWG